MSIRPIDNNKYENKRQQKQQQNKYIKQRNKHQKTQELLHRNKHKVSIFQNNNISFYKNPYLFDNDDDNIVDRMKKLKFHKKTMSTNQKLNQNKQSLNQLVQKQKQYKNIQFSQNSSFAQIKKYTQDKIYQKQDQQYQVQINFQGQFNRNSFNNLNNFSNNSIKSNNQYKFQNKQNNNNNNKSINILSNNQINIQNNSNNSGKSLKQQKNQDNKQQENNKQKQLNLKIKFQIFKKRIKNLLQKIPFQIFITFLTLMSLFMEDFRTIFIQNTYDSIIDYVNLVLLFVFFVQILMSLVVQNYAFSFFFYLDIISTFSIFMDVTLITNIIYNTGGANNQQLSIIISQSKASRAAARAVRIMKIFRLARVVKLYKSALKTKQLNQQKQKQKKCRLKNKKKNQQHLQNHMNINFQNTTQQNNKQNNRLQTSDNNILSHNKNNSKISNGLIRNGSSQRSQFGNRFQLAQGMQLFNNMLLLNQGTMSRKSELKPTVIKQLPKEHQDLNQKQKQQRKDKFLEIKGLLNSEFNTINEENIIIDNQKDKKNNINFRDTLQLNKQQSNISKILTDSTIKKIIIVILVIMFSMTVMDITNYYPQNTSWDFLTQYVVELLQQPDVPISYINKIIQKNINSYQIFDANYQVIAIETPFNQLYLLTSTKYDQLRITQIGISQTDIDTDKILKIRSDLTQIKIQNNTETTTNRKISYSQNDAITIVLSFKQFNQIDSCFSICKIVFICVIILYLLQSFNSNITNLVVTPIQKMLQIVINPDKKIQQDQEQNQDFQQARYQTMIVSKAIVKIRGLMSTIFGKIGMDLLYKQLFKEQSISAKNYLNIKKKSHSVYGICKIQNFIEISETLQADTFDFVNEIAEIVHKAVYRYGGYGVRNLSDGFLIVFNLPSGREQEILDEQMKSKYSKQIKNNYLNILCDFSLFSFVKTIIRLHKQPQLIKYKKDQRILHRFGNKFQIQMSFALSFGQSIEGIIGSQYKIDPVYLGGKLEELYKMLTIAEKHPNLIILDKQLHDKFTIGLQRHCRLMDLVKLNEYEEGNTEIFAVDLDLQYISPAKSKAQKTKKKQDQYDIHLKKQVNMQYLRDSVQIQNYSAADFISSKKQLRQVLRKKYSQQMRKKYEMAFHSYSIGEWTDAKLLLEQILRISKQDILTQRIYKYISIRNFHWNQSVDKYKEISNL